MYVGTLQQVCHNLIQMVAHRRKKREKIRTVVVVEERQRDIIRGVNGTQ